MDKLICVYLPLGGCENFRKIVLKSHEIYLAVVHAMRMMLLNIKEASIKKFVVEARNHLVQAISFIFVDCTRPYSYINNWVVL
jgi:hypothetical protein